MKRTYYFIPNQELSAGTPIISVEVGENQRDKKLYPQVYSHCFSRQHYFGRDIRFTQKLSYCYGMCTSMPITLQELWNALKCNQLPNYEIRSNYQVDMMFQKFRQEEAQKLGWNRKFA